MKLLTFSTLYPNSAQPSHGIFVENRLRHLLASGRVQSRVIAPVPWFPFTHSSFGDYARFAQVAREEQRHGIVVKHPRYPLIPKIGMSITPWLMAKAVIDEIRESKKSDDFDIIDAHYFYPDGVAAAMLAKRLNKPLVITARGTDLNLIPQHYAPRKMILWAARQAAALITVCQALKDVLVDLGVAAERVTVLRNGVDLVQFSPPKERDVLRAKLGLTGTVLLSVGHLIERKGHDLAIRSLAELPNTRLLIAGEGPERDSLTSIVNERGLGHRVQFLGAVSQHQLRDYYGAADILILASSREGWANVLLESMACGTPVVASDVWGTPEVVAAPEAGVLMAARTPEAVAQAVTRLLHSYPDRAATRRYAERFSWDATTHGQLELFSNVLKGARS